MVPDMQGNIIYPLLLVILLVLFVNLAIAKVVVTKRLKERARIAKENRRAAAAQNSGGPAAAEKSGEGAPAEES